MKYQIISLKYFFAVKGTIYHLAIIAVMIYRYVKITCYFHVCR